MVGAREVSESCVDNIIIEMVSTYCDRFYQTKPELAARRIEAIGYQVGLQLSERYTMERARFSDHLEAIKFICKDIWSEVFKKQIDNLKTNHRGTFVCKIISSRGLHACQLIHLKQTKIHQTTFPWLQVKARQHNLPACIYIFLVGS